MNRTQFLPQTDENQYLYSLHKVNLTGSEISTILYYLEWKVEELNDTGNSEDVAPEIDRIFAELQSVTDSYYAYQEQLELTKQRKLEAK